MKIRSLLVSAILLILANLVNAMDVTAPFLEALERKNHDEVTRLINEVDLSKTDKFNHNAVAIPIFNNDEVGLKLVLNRLIELPKEKALEILNAKDSDGDSPLKIATDFQYENLKNLLLEYEDKIKNKLFSGNMGDSSNLEYLKQELQSAFDKRKKEELEEILQQISKEHPQQAYALITSLNLKDHSPSKNNKIKEDREEFNSLIQKAIRAAKDMRKSEIEKMCKKGDGDIINYIFTLASRKNSQYLKCELYIIKEIYREKMYTIIDAKNDQNMTPLMLAAQLNDYHTVKVLLQFDANKYIENKAKKFACCYATNNEIKSHLSSKICQCNKK